MFSFEKTINNILGKEKKRKVKQKDINIPLSSAKKAIDSKLQNKCDWRVGDKIMVTDTIKQGEECVTGGRPCWKINKGTYGKILKISGQDFLIEFDEIFTQHRYGYHGIWYWKMEQHKNEWITCGGVYTFPIIRI